MQNFKTLEDLKKQEKQDKQDKNNQKKPNNTYAGGEKSGLAVQQPDDFDELISKAQTAEPYQEGKDDPKSTVKITLWKNGFQVNDGEFREVPNPKNDIFIKELKENRVPTELRGQYPKGLSVVLNDKTRDVYVPPPPPKYVEFSGSGVSLGGPQPQQQKQQQQQQYQPKPGQQAVPKMDKVPVDESQPTTMIQVRLQSGKMLQVQINTSTKVQVLYDFVRSQTGLAAVKLMAGFPPKAIANLQQTIEEADLLDSLVNQSV